MKGVESKVSVVCAWYNRADRIHETLESVLTQNYPNFDITIVNDGSSDPTVAQILDAYAGKNVNVIHQKNTGFTNAIRRAIEESDGEYIAIQGAGDVSLPGRLAAQVAYLEAKPQYALVACLHTNRKIKHGKASEVEIASAPKDEATALDLAFKNPIGHGQVMMRREVYSELGGYDASFTFSQDQDLWLRMSQRYRLGVLNEVRYERRIFDKEGVGGSWQKTLDQIRFSAVSSRRSFQSDNFLEKNGTIKTIFYRIWLEALILVRVNASVRSAYRRDGIGFRDLDRVYRFFGILHFISCSVLLTILMLLFRASKGRVS